MSGKTTLVNFVTACLAGDWLNSPNANLRRLGEPSTVVDLDDLFAPLAGGGSLLEKHQ